MKLLLITLFVLMYGCASSPQTAITNGINIEKKQKEWDECLYNSDSTLLLCTTVDTVLTVQGIRQLRFSVFDSKSLSILYDDQLQNGRVEWAGTQTILVTKGLGYLNHPQNGVEKYFVDLGAKQRRAVPEDYNQK